MWNQSSLMFNHLWNQTWPISSENHWEANMQGRCNLKSYTLQIWSKPYANLLYKQEQKANIWTRTGTQASCKNNQWTRPFSNSVLIRLCLTRHSDPGHVRIYRCGFEWSFLKRCWQHWQHVEEKLSGFGCMKAFSNVLLYFFFITFV